MITFKFYIDSRSGSPFLKLRITNNRRSATYSVGFEMSEAVLEDALSPRPRPENVRWARMLGEWKRRLVDLKADLMMQGKGRMEAREVMTLAKEYVFDAPEETDDGKVSFGDFYLKMTRKRENKGYRASSEYTWKKMVEFCKERGWMAPDRVAFEDISLKWLNEFDEWLAASGAAQNTRAIHFKNIRTVFNRALDEELTDKYPFRRFKIRTEATRKRALTVEELRRLFSMEVEPYQVFYRDMFKLIFMLVGINVVDLYNLERVTADGRVEYRRAKTKRLYSVKVEPEALELIEAYRGERKLISAADRWKDHRDFTRWLNSALKKVGRCEIVGRGGKKKIEPFWPEISSYWARHTWATIAYDLDVPKDVIAQALGHGKSDVTEVYIRRDRRKVDEANRMVLDWVLYGRR